MALYKCPVCCEENPDTAKACAHCGAYIAPYNKARKNPAQEVLDTASQSASEKPKKSKLRIWKRFFPLAYLSKNVGAFIGGLAINLALIILLIILGFAGGLLYGLLVLAVIGVILLPIHIALCLIAGLYLLGSLAVQITAFCVSASKKKKARLEAASAENKP